MAFLDRAEQIPAGAFERDFGREIFRYLDDHGPSTETALLEELGRGHSARTRQFLRRQWDWLRRTGWVVAVDRNRSLWGVETVSGPVQLHPKGFGFVLREGSDAKDVFVPERALGDARHGDQVRVWVRANLEGKGPEGRVVEVVRRSVEEVVGRLKRMGTQWVVVPADLRWPTVAVDPPSAGDIREDDMVAATVVEWPSERWEPARGVIRQLVGHAEDPDLDVRTIIAERHLRVAFPEAALRQAAGLPEAVEEPDIVGRLDLRQALVVTIDGEDAKDLDDAVSLEKIDGGFRLGVHIADVSHYVPEDSPLDEEGRERGTSVYLVDRVLPMFPERLSNGIASLNPGVDRLTLSVVMELDGTGQVRRAQCYRSVIRSRHRLTYEAVNRALAGEPGVFPEDLLRWLQLAQGLKVMLRARRLKRGAVDFDLPEAKVVLDADGRPREILRREHGEAEQIIEEFMILANESVATLLSTQRLPAIYRIHEPPEEDKMNQFRVLAGVFGLHLPKVVTPRALSQMLRRTKGRPEESIIQRVLLRSMRQARYSPANMGHFGLASEQYLHFTSPIRRYPDLFVHRVVKAALVDGRRDEAELARWQDKAAVVAGLASQREREAMEAERESVEAKAALYMAERIGEDYPGLISGVTGFGLFVELPNLVEGLIPLEGLPHDRWVHDPVHYTLTGTRSGLRFRLGDPIEVRVEAVDVALHRITLGLRKAPAARADARGRRPYAVVYDRPAAGARPRRNRERTAGSGSGR